MMWVVWSCCKSLQRQALFRLFYGLRSVRIATFQTAEVFVEAGAIFLGERGTGMADGLCNTVVLADFF